MRTCLDTTLTLVDRLQRLRADGVAQAVPHLPPLPRRLGHDPGRKRRVLSPLLGARKRSRRTVVRLPCACASLTDKPLEPQLA